MYGALKISSLEKVDFSTDKNLLSDYHISSDTVLTALAANYPSQVLRIRLTSLLHHAALLDMRFLLEDMIRYASPFATDDGNSTIIITDDNPNDNRHLSAIGMSETLAMSFVGGFIIMAIFEKYRFYKQIYLKRLQNRFRVSEFASFVCSFSCDFTLFRSRIECPHIPQSLSWAGSGRFRRSLRWRCCGWSGWMLTCVCDS